MSNELFQTIEQVAREKSIDVDVIVEAMQDAIVAASKKYYKTRENLVSRFIRDSGELEVYAQKTVVEEVEDDDIEISLEEAQKIAPEATLDAIIEFPRSTEGLTRVAAQAEELAEARVLDILLPGKAGIEPSESTTRERLREMLRNGKLDDRTVEVEVSTQGPAPNMEILTGQGMEEMGLQIQDMLE